MSLPVNIHTHRLSDPNAIEILSGDSQSFGDFRLSETDKNAFLSVAFHPLYWTETDTHLPEYASGLLQQNRVIAIGESGLDRASVLPIEWQMDLFREQMVLSAATGLPIIIHCVGRWNELELLFKEKQPGTPAWIIHGFRKTKLADKFLDLGAYLSFGRALLHDELLQQLAAKAPFDRIFLETDGADVSIEELYETLAAIKSLPLPAVIYQLYNNFRTTFTDGKLA